MNLVAKLTNISRSPGDPKVLKIGPSVIGAADSLARKLGWLSIALGVFELVAADRVAGALGMSGKESLIRAYGTREISSGILSLSVDKPAGMWSRVAGDVLDIATLLPAFRHENPKRGNVGLALAIVAGVALLDLVGAQGVTTRHSRGHVKPRDYSDRTGFPGGLAAARQAARAGRTSAAGAA
ncbi:hypothetical protein FJ941_25750 [Mesorhizobium sp. B2-3-13]|uniref:hypothetical protein n=1 Tax=unclassified Mesorhizobium TaxID=325217 RepID=UPI00112738B8|nr:MULTISPECIES: hypothetical protein [unclassified Mesorhizobium]TPJ40046.1 hypothetical protein FJ432_17730 [Mesorhizobium sp. B2-6-5]TPL75592.1 hypothetical protein FJ941_25750 [Mesorhizobium sp. B2-3-13]TPM05457.1 hypothetical protein FJ960_13780 [Mesorhizobium sp. B2-3-11]